MLFGGKNDDTILAIDTVVQECTKKHSPIEVVRRGNRQGSKAGALQTATEKTREDFIAIFDADLTPLADCLVRTLPHLLQGEFVGVPASCPFGSMAA